MAQPDSINQMSPNFLEFWDYWNSLSKSGFVPALSNFLDQAPPHLQPNVSMMDTLAADQMRVRHMGTAVTEVLGEQTGANAEDLYSEQVHDKAALVAWAATNHPCGYTVKRGLVTTTSRPIQVSSIVLPVGTKSETLKTLIAYNHITPGELSVAREQGLKAVIEFGDAIWLDIGAGTPAPQD